jgi:alanine racemase
MRHNLAAACERAAGRRVWAVVKANAYGHGIERAVQGFGIADGLALIDLDEARRARAAGWTRPILLLEGPFQVADVVAARELGMTVVVHNVEQLRLLESAPSGVPLGVYLKLNTGMNRLGLSAAELRPALARLQVCRNVGEITLMTHFACADDAGGIAGQLERFDAATAGLALPVSLANSATLLRYPHAARGWVRAGIMLYGASPFTDRSAAQLGLEPVMTLESRLIAVHTLSPGDAVGYGAEFRAAGPMRIGVVACGYADGYPRHATTGTPILVDGRHTRTLGRVSMDMLCVDLTELPDAGVGAPVVLWGEGLPVEDVAAAAGTISYELLCALAPRVPVVEAP